MPIIIIGFSFLLAAIFTSLKKDEKKKAVVKHIPTIKTFEAKKRNFQIYLEKDGHVVSKYEYPLISEVHGEILYLSDYFNNNLVFEKDELLLQVDSSYYSIDRRNAKALLDAAILENEMQRAIHERSQIELNNYKKENVNDLAKKIPQLNSSKSNLDAAEANYERAILNLNKTSFKAPFRGRVKSNRSSKGMVVSQGSQLATIYSVEDLVLKLPLQLNEVRFLNILDDNNFKIDLSLNIGGEIYSLKGKYEGVSGAVDRLTQSVFLNVSLEDFSNLELMVDNNLFVNAKIYGKEYSGVYILPNAAIRDNNMIHIVENERLVPQEIKIIKTYQDSTVIECGNLDNQIVNLTPLEYYVNNMQVKVSD